ncbi:MAG: hypothetical protein QCI38_02885 [Candidatus Thermoplasmatota archaeon]|nr:hypothetical protein [Candidatus Thermoplasmatota archaeon]
MITDALTPFFEPFGAVGLVFLVGIIAYFDAMTFPLLPEVTFIVSFLLHPQLGVDPLFYGIALLASIAIFESAGVYSIYYVVDHITVPKRVKKVATRYLDMMFVSDERVILMDRIVPAVPFVGVFISFCNWNVKKAIAYNVLGCLVKYSILLIFAGTLAEAYTSGFAGDMTMFLVLIIVGLSIAVNYSWDKKKKRGEKVEMLFAHSDKPAPKTCAIPDEPPHPIELDLHPLELLHHHSHEDGGGGEEESRSDVGKEQAQSPPVK